MDGEGVRMREEVAQFGAARGLVGIVSDPPAGTHLTQDLPAVVLLNAGLVHRVGPNRLYVKIARALACEGFTVLRLDFSGIGDSSPRADHLPYLQSAQSEAQEAMEWLSRHRGARRFVLMGHCSGAGFSMLLAGKDARVAGAALLNLEGGDGRWTEYDRIRKESKQYANQYSRRALFSREHWGKLLSGRANYRSIFSNILKGVIWYRLKGKFFEAQQALRGRSSVTRAAQAELTRTYLEPIVQRAAPLLLIHSEGGTGLAQLHAGFGDNLDRLEAEGRLQLKVIAQCDHLFTLLARQRAVCETLVTWARAQFIERQGTLSADRVNAAE